MIFTDVTGRVAKQLLRLAHHFGVQDDLVGSSRETVNEVLSGFCQRGWIRFRGKSIVITDSERLARRAR